MSTILHAIQNASMDTVEASGIFFRVRKVCSADLARVGFAALAVATPSSAPAPDGETGDTGEELASVLSRISPKQAEHLAGLQDATVCAGCVAVREPDGEWETLTLVVDASKADPDQARLWVGSLPAGVIEVLFQRIMELSTDGGEAADRLRSFRGGGSECVARDTPRGEDLRQASARNLGA